MIKAKKINYQQNYLKIRNASDLVEPEKILNPLFDYTKFSIVLQHGLSDNT